MITTENYDEHIAIQRGEKPARTIRQLVDAQRQNFAGAGADLLTLEMLLAMDLPDDAAISETLYRLRGHIKSANAKATLALEATEKE